MNAKVTRVDREAAVQALRECGPSVDAWVPAGRKKAGLIFNTDLERVAEAIAEARASVVDTELAGAERAVVEAAMVKHGAAVRFLRPGPQSSAHNDMVVADAELHERCDELLALRAPEKP